jgi:tetratricopeptide (TPR) repeat protein
VKLETTHCPGDAVRLGPLSRAALTLRDGAILRLDQNTTITFTPAPERAATWIELLTGAVHFWSRIPRGLRITTPFVNGSVEGTEFLIEVDAVETRLSVWEGQVLAENAHGSVTLAAGQSAAARAGQAPTLRPIVLRSPNAVTWTLYYPPVLDLRPEDFPDRPGETWHALVRRSIEEARRGDLAAALASAAGIPDTAPDPRAFTHRAGLLLAVGRADEAQPDIDRALRLAPQSGDALALQAVVAVAKNDEVAAREAAARAIQLAPGSAAAHLADSYVRQARFDLEGALASAQQAAKIQPGNSLAHARVAELWQSLGNLDRAQEAATEAARLDPASARAQTVLGFAALTRIDRREAAKAFEEAIRLDPAAPLPRLGLGLTRIRGGDLAGGRQQLEIAVGLDPGDSLLRSYLGKAYYEERRPALAAEQFRLAQELDPNDPTPWLYDAIRLQSVNRPVEALQSLQRSIELNDNRAVYRSRLQLDEDRATRSVNLARIYDDLGFQQVALVEGWTSLERDPANYTAHRFLADSYSVLPRHEVARVSELFQAQMLQPLNLTPVQPQFTLSRSFILAGAGPADPSFNEFNALFERNRLSLLASGIVGGNDTWGDQVVVSGLWNQFSISVGQFHFESDGFRPNNDQTRDVYTIFAQAAITPRTSVLVDFRATDFDRGDLELRLDPDNFSTVLRQDEDEVSVRLGIRHDFSPRSTLLAWVGYGYATDRGPVDVDFDLTVKEKAYVGELQHILRLDRVSLNAGLSYADVQVYETQDFAGDVSSDRSDTKHATLYAYSLLRYVPDTTVTLGVSVDLFEGRGDIDTTQWNPKVGLTWTPHPSTTLRGALVRTFKRQLINDQTLEPTQVAGFNQFFDDVNGTDTWRYGVAVDQQLLASLYAGLEVSRRDLTVPLTSTGPSGLRIEKLDWQEDLGRAYLYWAPLRWLALGVTYQYEQLERDPQARNVEQIAKLRTHRIPVDVSLFHPRGLTLRLRGTYVNQRGDVGDAEGTVSSRGDDFLVFDASLAYRLPRRWGLISLEARNLFDQRIRFQDTDPANPTIYPERLILARFTLAF